MNQVVWGNNSAFPPWHGKKVFLNCWKDLFTPNASLSIDIETELLKFLSIYYSILLFYFLQPTQSNKSDSCYAIEVVVLEYQFSENW